MLRRCTKVQSLIIHSDDDEIIYDYSVEEVHMDND